MTKRRLLVSLFLVFGLAAMATSGLAVTWTVTSPNPYLDGRPQGLTEPTGAVLLSLKTGGTTTSGGAFEFDYNGVVTNVGVVVVACGGGPTSPWYNGGVPSITCFNTVTSNLSYPSAGHSTVIVTFGTPWTFTTGDGSYFTVQVRIGANSLPCPGEVDATVSTPNIDSNNGLFPQSPVGPLKVLGMQCGTVGPDLSLQYKYEQERGGPWVLGTAATALSCIGFGDGDKPWEDDFGINVDEEFPNALTSLSYEYSIDPGSPTDITNPTYLVVTFSNVPKGVWIKFEGDKPCGLMNSDDPNYCLGGTLTIGPPTVTTSPEVGIPPVYQIIMSFPTLTEDNGNKENIDLWFEVVNHSKPIAPGYGPIMAAVTLGPTSPSTDIPLFDGSAEAKPLPVVNFSDCQTFLLYTYVTNYPGYDTGIEVSNTSLDPFATDPTLSTFLSKGAAKPQNGPCTFYIYGNGGLVTTYTTGTIDAGSTDAFQLSVFAPGLAGGYVIAACQFQNAVGYATIEASHGSDTNYLAYVIPNPEWYHRFPGGDFLGEFAIAPVLLDPKGPISPYKYFGF